MSWPANVSILFLLVITVSVTVESTTYLKEIHIDVHDSGRRNADDRDLPNHKSARQRRMLSNFDRDEVIHTLNRLRRSLGAPDMYYANWDRELEKSASDLTSGCDLMASAQSLPAKYTRGLTGYTRVHGVAGEIEKIYFQGSNSTLYWQIMSSHLVYVGCAVGVRPCNDVPHQPPRRVFTCLFTYSRPVTRWKPASSTSSSPSCSLCDQDALWCDAGLCRTGCRYGDTGCERSDKHDCETTCSQCDDAVSKSHCQCICYYANDRRRCTGNAAYATKNQPICRATNSGLDTPAGFLSLTVCVLLAFIIICILMVCCITRCRSRKRRQRQSAGAARRSAQGNGSTLGDLATSSSSSPSAFVVGPPIILSPPLYDDIEGTDSRPPPYYQCLSSVGDGTQLSSVADLPSPLSVEPTAPPTQNHDLTNLSDEQPGASGMPAYSNPAYSDSGV